MSDTFVNNLGSSSPGGGQIGGANTNTTADQLRNQVLSQVATNLASVTAALQAAFPQASSSIAPTATAGTASLPAAPANFLAVTINGTAFKIPLYNP